MRMVRAKSPSRLVQSVALGNPAVGAREGWTDMLLKWVRGVRQSTLLIQGDRWATECDREREDGECLLR